MNVRPKDQAWFDDFQKRFPNSSPMGCLPCYYLTLFNRVTDAISALDRQDFGMAKKLLVSGQQKAEEQYLTAPD